METALWIVQASLAALFLATGLTKLTQPRAKMAAGMMAWAADVSDLQFRTVGALEVAGAIGVLVPALAPFAAVGLALTMVGAAATHVRYDEWTRLAVPIVVFALALLVAVERFGAHAT